MIASDTQVLSSLCGLTSGITEKWRTTPQTHKSFASKVAVTMGMYIIAVGHFNSSKPLARDSPGSASSSDLVRSDIQGLSTASHQYREMLIRLIQRLPASQIKAIAMTDEVAELESLPVLCTKVPTINVQNLVVR
jgi:hypothetical protein